ncbi:transcription factor bHLH126-like [Fagus crenata]
MFTFPQSDELLWQFSPIPHQEDFIPQDLIPDQASLWGSDFANNMGKDLTYQIQHNDEANTINNTKKITRRDTERQRRKKMAMLNASLRSLLPIEMIKGKRSVTDHMDEAFNYINYLKNKIEELSGRRNELKKLSNLSVLSPGNERVIVHPIRDGVEILVSSNVNEGLLPSEVLEILLNEGLGVERYLSTRANERLCYTIISQGNDLECLDLSGLQQKLNDLILSSRYLYESDIISTC